jgi:hypothetical protein
LTRILLPTEIEEQRSELCCLVLRIRTIYVEIEPEHPGSKVTAMTVRCSHSTSTKLAIGCGGGGDSSRVFFDAFFLKSGNPFMVILLGVWGKTVREDKQLGVFTAIFFGCRFSGSTRILAGSTRILVRNQKFHRTALVLYVNST